MLNTPRLISNYKAVDLFQLRQAGNRSHPVDSPYSTFSLEYYVEYTTMCSALKFHPGIRHKWNVLKDGFPTPHNLRKWCREHDQKAEEAGHELLTVKAALRRCSNGEVMAEVEL
jgi:hypothetical protein